VFRYQRPAALYTTEDGTVRATDESAELSVDGIQARFSAKLGKGDADDAVCCSYVYIDRQNKDDETQNVIMEDMNAKQLRHFLLHRRKENNGVLQRFVPSKSAKHSVIRAVWTPRTLQVPSSLPPCPPRCPGSSSRAQTCNPLTPLPPPAPCALTLLSRTGPGRVANKPAPPRRRPCARRGPVPPRFLPPGARAPLPSRALLGSPFLLPARPSPCRRPPPSSYSSPYHSPYCTLPADSHPPLLLFSLPLTLLYSPCRLPPRR